MNLAKNSGNLMIGTGVIHNSLGFIMGRKTLADMVTSGFINSVNSQMDRNAIYWFLFSGFMMIILGKFMQDYLNENEKPLPISVGYYLFALTLLGCIIMPITGLWLAFPQAIIIIIAGRSDRNSLPIVV